MIPSRAARLACAAVAILAFAAATALQGDHAAQDPPGLLTAALASADVSAKFDDGFYGDIQRWIGEAGAAGATGSSDAPTTRNVMIFVGRTSADGRDPETVASENKDTVVSVLGEIGATNVVRAKSLSFVTATVPLGRIAELAAYGSVHRIGDGEALLRPSVGTARGTIDAMRGDLTLSGGTILSGRGVNVAVLDNGIKSLALDSKVLKSQHCADLSGCRATVMADRIPDPTKTDVQHGTEVAGVLAASSGTTTFPAGIATGVTLFDVIIQNQVRHGTDGAFMTAIANGLDWAHANGAHVANISFGRPGCAAGGTGALIVDEAVAKGMVVVGAAGNEGKADQTAKAPRPDRAYESIQGPHCSHNPIVVGGVNDRGQNGLKMYGDASRGPTKSTDASISGLLKPDIAAPAEDLTILTKRDSYVAANNGEGTSLAAPQVAAAAALLLEARPSMTPVEVKAALLLGATWQGTGKCTASMYEASDSSSYCSHARQLTSAAASDRDVTLLNHVGLGVLNVKDSIKYATTAGHVLGDHLASKDDRKTYTFRVTDATKPAKVVLSWISLPKGSIAHDKLGSRNAAEITALQLAPPKLANLNLSVQKGASAEHLHVSNSARQSVEFVHFTPVAGTYTVTVSASKLGERPTQPFALASTHALTTTPSNTAPSVTTRTVVVDPSAPSAVRLVGTDAQRDSISFSVTGAPRGTVSTSERLSESVSRVVYTPKDTFGTGDTITVTPSDGQATGTARTVALLPGSTPAGSTRPDPSRGDITDWREMSFAYDRVDRPASFSPGLPAAPVRRVMLEAMAVDGAVFAFREGSSVHKVAAPWGDPRQLELASPTTITGAHFSAAGPEEAGEEGLLAVGYSAHARSSICPTAGTASPVAHSLAHTRVSGEGVPDGSGKLTSVAGVRHNGTATSVSVSVDITHKYRGHLTVSLVPPSGNSITLHDRTGRSADNIDATYSGTVTSSLVGKEISGEWSLVVKDSRLGHRGTLNDWTLNLGYTATCPGTAPQPTAPAPNQCPDPGASGASSGTACPTPTPTPTPTTPLSDDFEGGLAKWAKSGQRNWTTSTSGAHGIPTAPGKSSTNSVLHADACRYICHVTSTGFVDLSSAASATLTFKRFVDRGLDAGEYLRVQASRDGGLTWARLAEWTGSSSDSNRWVSESHDLASYLGSSLFKLRFTTKQTLSSEDVQVDDVAVSVTARAAAPAPAPPPPPAPAPNARSPCDASASSSTCLYYTRYAEQCLGASKPSRCSTYSTLITGAGYALPTAPPAPSPPPAPAPAPRPSPSPAPASYSVYVADTDDREVVTYSSSGTPTGTFVASRSGGLGDVWGIDFGPDGHLYVADHDNSAIRRYSGSTGAPMGTGSDASTNAEWARTSSRPYGIDWEGSTLYVATYQGVERFSSTGTALGLFGDATRTSSVRNAALSYPHDVEAADGRLYVADRHHNRVAYYSAAAGAYQGEAKSGYGLDTRRPGGLASHGGHLWQAGDDPGYVNKLASPALTLVRKFTGSSIDEPYGVDVAPNGNVYVAMKDDDRVVVITPSGSLSQLSPSRLDDPRGVAVGPRYAPAAGSDGAAGGASGAAPNSEPELEVLVGGEPAPPLIEVAVSSTPATVSLRATDAEGDSVTFSLWTASAAAPIALADNGDGTAALTITASAPGEHPFEVAVSDAHGEEWAPHILRIVPAAPAPPAG